MQRQLLLGVIAVGLVTLPLAAQQAPPPENVDVAEEVLAEIALAEEFDEVDDRLMRMRINTIAPGGATALHSHENRPAVVYVLAGTGTEYRGTEVVTRQAGDVLADDHETEHWWRNDGDVPLVLLQVDIYQPE